MPLNIFLIFQNVKPTIYTSEVLSPNHYVIVLPTPHYHAINAYLSKSLFFYYSTLIEMSAIDNLKYNSLFSELNYVTIKNRFYFFLSFYNYSNKLRLTFFYPTSLTKKKSIGSIAGLFKNAGWLERETTEMFSINFLNKKDNRSLLLDYSKNEYPMLKDFPCEGFVELYYDFFDQHIHYVESEHIEL